MNRAEMERESEAALLRYCRAKLARQEPYIVGLIEILITEGNVEQRAQWREAMRLHRLDAPRESDVASALDAIGQA